MPEDFPTMEQVENADREQIATWYRFLSESEIPYQQNIKDRIVDRFKNMGGMTPGLSKKIGFTPAPGYDTNS
jgi:hypothetical protein